MKTELENALRSFNALMAAMSKPAESIDAIIEQYKNVDTLARNIAQQYDILDKRHGIPKKSEEKKEQSEAEKKKEALLSSRLKEKEGNNLVHLDVDHEGKLLKSERIVLLKEGILELQKNMEQVKAKRTALLESLNRALIKKLGDIEKDEKLSGIKKLEAIDVATDKVKREMKAVLERNEVAFPEDEVSKIKTAIYESLANQILLLSKPGKDLSETLNNIGKLNSLRDELSKRKDPMPDTLTKAIKAASEFDASIRKQIELALENKNSAEFLSALKHKDIMAKDVSIFDAGNMINLLADKCYKAFGRNNLPLNVTEVIAQEEKKFLEKIRTQKSEMANSNFSDDMYEELAIVKKLADGWGLSDNVKKELQEYTKDLTTKVSNHNQEKIKNIIDSKASIKEKISELMRLSAQLTRTGISFKITLNEEIKQKLKALASEVKDSGEPLITKYINLQEMNKAIFSLIKEQNTEFSTVLSELEIAIRKEYSNKSHIIERINLLSNNVTSLDLDNVLTRIEELDSLIAIVYNKKDVPKDVLDAYQNCNRALSDRLAQLFANTSLKLFSNIPEAEFTNPKNYPNRTLSPNLNACIDFFNNVNKLGNMTTFGYTPSANENIGLYRDKAMLNIERWVYILEKCITEHRDFNVGMAIYNFLNTSHMQRMLEYNEVLSKKTTQVIQLAKEVFNFGNNFANLRAFYAQHESQQEVFVPYIGQYTGQLTFAYEGNPDEANRKVAIETSFAPLKTTLISARSKNESQQLSPNDIFTPEQMPILEENPAYDAMNRIAPRTGKELKYIDSAGKEQVKNLRDLTSKVDEAIGSPLDSKSVQQLETNFEQINLVAEAKSLCINREGTNYSDFLLAYLSNSPLYENWMNYHKKEGTDSKISKFFKELDKALSPSGQSDLKGEFREALINEAKLLAFLKKHYQVADFFTKQGEAFKEIYQSWNRYISPTVSLDTTLKATTTATPLAKPITSQAQLGQTVVGVMPVPDRSRPFSERSERDTSPPKTGGAPSSTKGPDEIPEVMRTVVAGKGEFNIWREQDAKERLAKLQKGLPSSGPIGLDLAKTTPLPTAKTAPPASKKPAVFSLAASNTWVLYWDFYNIKITDVSKASAEDRIARHKETMKAMGSVSANAEKFIVEADKFAMSEKGKEGGDYGKAFLQKIESDLATEQSIKELQNSITVLMGPLVELYNNRTKPDGYMATLDKLYGQVYPNEIGKFKQFLERIAKPVIAFQREIENAKDAEAILKATENFSSVLEEPGNLTAYIEYFKVAEQLRELISKDTNVERRKAADDLLKDPVVLDNKQQSQYDLKSKIIIKPIQFIPKMPLLLKAVAGARENVKDNIYTTAMELRSKFDIASGRFNYNQALTEDVTDPKTKKSLKDIEDAKSINKITHEINKIISKPEMLESSPQVKQALNQNITQAVSELMAFCTNYKIEKSNQPFIDAVQNIIQLGKIALVYNCDNPFDQANFYKQILLITGFIKTMSALEPENKDLKELSKELMQVMTANNISTVEKLDLAILKSNANKATNPKEFNEQMLIAENAKKELLVLLYKSSNKFAFDMSQIRPLYDTITKAYLQAFSVLPPAIQPQFNEEWLDFRKKIANHLLTMEAIRTSLGATSTAKVTLGTPSTLATTVGPKSPAPTVQDTSKKELISPEKELSDLLAKPIFSPKTVAPLSLVKHLGSEKKDIDRARALYNEIAAKKGVTTPFDIGMGVDQFVKQARELIGLPEIVVTVAPPVTLTSTRPERPPRAPTSVPSTIPPQEIKALIDRISTRIQNQNRQIKEAFHTADRERQVTRATYEQCANLLNDLNIQITQAQSQGVPLDQINIWKDELRVPEQQVKLIRGLFNSQEDLFNHHVQRIRNEIDKLATPDQVDQKYEELTKLYDDFKDIIGVEIAENCVHLMDEVLKHSESLHRKASQAQVTAVLPTVELPSLTNEQLRKQFDRITDVKMRDMIQGYLKDKDTIDKKWTSGIANEFVNALNSAQSQIKNHADYVRVVQEAATKAGALACAVDILVDQTIFNNKFAPVKRVMSPVSIPVTVPKPVKIPPVPPPASLSGSTTPITGAGVKAKTPNLAVTAPPRPLPKRPLLQPKTTPAPSVMKTPPTPITAEATLINELKGVAGIIFSPFNSERLSNISDSTKYTTSQITQLKAVVDACNTLAKVKNFTDAPFPLKHDCTVLELRQAIETPQLILQADLKKISSTFFMPEPRAQSPEPEYGSMPPVSKQPPQQTRIVEPIDTNAALRERQARDVVVPPPAKKVPSTLPVIEALSEAPVVRPQPLPTTRFKLTKAQTKNKETCVKELENLRKNVRENKVAKFEKEQLARSELTGKVNVDLLKEKSAENRQTVQVYVTSGVYATSEAQPYDTRTPGSLYRAQTRGVEEATAGDTNVKGYADEKVTKEELAKRNPGKGDYLSYDERRKAAYQVVAGQTTAISYGGYSTGGPKPVTPYEPPLDVIVVKAAGAQLEIKDGLEYQHFIIDPKQNENTMSLQIWEKQVLGIDQLPKYDDVRRELGTQVSNDKYLVLEGRVTQEAVYAGRAKAEDLNKIGLLYRDKSGAIKIAITPEEKETNKSRALILNKQAFHHSMKEKLKLALSAADQQVAEKNVRDGNDKKGCVNACFLGTGFFANIDTAYSITPEVAKIYLSALREVLAENQFPRLAVVNLPIFDDTKDVVNTMLTTETTRINGVSLTKAPLRDASQFTPEEQANYVPVIVDPGDAFTPAFNEYKRASVDANIGANCLTGRREFSPIHNPDMLDPSRVISVKAIPGRTVYQSLDTHLSVSAEVTLNDAVKGLKQMFEGIENIMLKTEVVEILTKRQSENKRVYQRLQAMPPERLRDIISGMNDLYRPVDQPISQDVFKQKGIAFLELTKDIPELGELVGLKRNIPGEPALSVMERTLKLHNFSTQAMTNSQNIIANNAANAKVLADARDLADENTNIFSKFGIYSKEQRNNLTNSYNDLIVLMEKLHREIEQLQRDKKLLTEVVSSDLLLVSKEQRELRQYRIKEVTDAIDLREKQVAQINDTCGKIKNGVNKEVIKQKAIERQEMVAKSKADEEMREVAVRPVGSHVKVEPQILVMLKPRYEGTIVRWSTHPVNYNSNQPQIKITQDNATFHNMPADRDARKIFMKHAIEELIKRYEFSKIEDIDFKGKDPEVVAAAMVIAQEAFARRDIAVRAIQNDTQSPAPQGPKGNPK